ncbi:ATP-dependent Clp protease proteolytic subunit, partial [Streptomyces anulatus]|uniref:ATP-dependent Clp protease proteolytic subunit n=1 Tax=Streptomyces anulatus TaxID=1892 RepID=UPI003446B354
MSGESNLPLFNAQVRRELYDQRVLVLDGPLDDDNGTLLTTQLIALATQDASTDIALWIHSPGGSVPSMLAIRDII